MNEMRFPEVPPPSGGRAEARASSGSLALGIVIAWAINVVGAIALLIAGGYFSSGKASNPDFWIPMLGAVIPLLASAVVVVGFILSGRTRTAVGIIIGIGSVWATALLLLAACFGLVKGVLG